jgi:hypothetical protein
MEPGRARIRLNLTLTNICRSISILHLPGPRSGGFKFSQALTSDHMVVRHAADAGICPLGPLLERSMTPPGKTSDLAQRQGLGAS